MVYDSVRKVVLLFGGDTNRGQLNDTWAWDGKAWKQLSPSGPPARGLPKMAFDTKRGVAVMFGGAVGEGRLMQDTWEWNGKAWQQLSNKGPEGRFLHAISYDEKRGKTVLFGGNCASPPSPNALDAGTWEWDGKTWTRVAEEGPDPRDHHAMARDGSRTILFGGGDSMGHLPETWAWDGTDWTKLKGNGPARSGHQMVWDSKGKRLLLFGGFYGATPTSELWQFKAGVWRRLS
jgi:hypothetical protein